jgi:flagellar hook protein FlgE
MAAQTLRDVERSHAFGPDHMRVAVAASGLACQPPSATLIGMQLGSLSSIASSGLRVETRRLEQSAQNVANVNTDGYEAHRVESHSRSQGGVTAAVYSRHGLPAQAAGDAPSASTTDLAEERVTQLSSLRSFQANIAVLRTADAMLGELVDRKA